MIEPSLKHYFVLGNYRIFFFANFKTSCIKKMEMSGAKCNKDKFASHEVICGVIFKDIFEVILMKAKSFLEVVFRYSERKLNPHYIL